VLNSFLNRIFNNLNWAITEFGVAAKEFQTALSRHFSEVQQFQRKCNVMFDFSFTLLRVLEFVSHEVPSIFLDQEMNLTRLSESLIFVLNRTTTGPDSKLFESILKMETMSMHLLYCGKLTVF
jgi:Kip1 ubiquitination-promoting complex protein 1